MNKKMLLAALALVVVVGLMLGAWMLTRPKAVDGGKTITVTIAHKDGTDQSYSWTTQANTLAEAMKEKNLLGEDDNGLYYTVDGETTDYNVDQSWWKILKNGEQVNEGANDLIIADGDSFRWEYTIGF